MSRSEKFIALGLLVAAAPMSGAYAQGGATPKSATQTRMNRNNG